MQTIAQHLVRNKSKLEVALPKHITADRMIRVVLNSLSKSRDLMECTIESLWESILEASTYGWEIGGPVAQAYLVPYRDTKRGVREAVLIPGYRGLMDLARRSGEISNIAYGVVHEGDRFVQPEDALDPILIHQPSDDTKRHERPITHVWAGYLFKSGDRVYCVMSAAEIDAHKKRYAKGWEKPDSAWQTSWDSMAIKTVLKRPIMKGQVPIAAEHQRLIMRDEVDGVVESSQIVADDQERIAHEQEALPDPGEITADDEWNMFANEVAERIAKAGNITQVNEAVERLNDEYNGDAHAKLIFDLAEERRKAIREGRGGQK